MSDERNDELIDDDDDEDLSGTAEELRHIKGDRTQSWKKGMYPPKPPRAREYDPDKHCGQATTTDGLPCTNPKGFHTNHLHHGRCRYHGGGGGHNLIKHGLYSRIQSPRILDALARVTESGTASLDLEPEVAMLRALVIDFTERHDEFLAGLIDFKESYEQARTMCMNATEPLGAMKAVLAMQAAINMRPTEILDISSVSIVIDRVGKMAERIHKMKQTSTITWESVQQLLDKMGLVLVRHITDGEIIDKIRKEWHDIEIKID